MNVSKPSRLFLVVLLSTLMSHLPSVALANGMISTAAAVDELSRAEATQKVQDFLSREDVQKALVKRGYTPAEVSSRLAGLSDRELNQLSQQMAQARYGGDILGLILIIVLIIFLIERI